MRFLMIAIWSTIGLTCTRAFTPTQDQEWTAFKLQFDKQYSRDEDMYRKGIFQETLEFIEKHNREAEQGLHTYEVGINEFADLTQEEFAEAYTGYLDTNDTEITEDELFVPPEQGYVPRYKNWAQEGKVARVKQQGRCGSCWAFCAGGALESQLAIKTGRLITLSEQNLLDCVREGYGCRGGLASFAYKYIKSNGGINSDSSYPYVGRKRRCRYDPQNSVTTISGYKYVKRMDEEALKYAVATIGPISGALYVGSIKGLTNYKSGIFNSPQCNKRVDHGILLVGYGTKNGMDYWIIKNSWGTSWGQQGYLHLERNKNMCNIAHKSLYPVL